MHNQPTKFNVYAVVGATATTSPAGSFSVDDCKCTVHTKSVHRCNSRIQARARSLDTVTSSAIRVWCSMDSSFALLYFIFFGSAPQVIINLNDSMYRMPYEYIVWVWVVHANLKQQRVRKTFANRMNSIFVETVWMRSVWARYCESSVPRMQ